MEKWRPVVGYEGLYEVSDMGQVRRAAPGRYTFVGKVLRAHPNVHGYPVVRLTKNGVQRTHPMHRLVVRAFLGERPARHEVNHMNSDRSDARLVNLEYVTRAENCKHSYAAGRGHGRRWVRGERHYRTRLTPAIVRAIREHHRGNRGGYLGTAICLGITAKSVGDIVRRHTWKHVS